MDGERAQHETARGGGGTLKAGRWGPQIVEKKGPRWSDGDETAFLDHLAATCNVTLAAAAVGFTTQALYARRRRDAGFMKRWDAALAQGYSHLEGLLIRRAIEVFGDFAPDPEQATRIPEMTVKEALILLGHHRRNVEGGPRSRRQWARPRTLDEVRDSILRKLEAIAPTSVPGGPANPPRPAADAAAASPEQLGEAQAGDE